MKIIEDGVLRDLSASEQAAWEVERAALAVPQQVTRTQALLALLELGATPITEAQVLAAIDQITDPLERERARILFQAPVWKRNNAFIASIGASFGLDPVEIDQLFQRAATL